MKKTSVICLFLVFSNMVIYSQHDDYYSDGYFLKRIEYNLSPFENTYNFNCKGEEEKIFFSDINAPVEFYFFPDYTGNSAFRIVKNLSKPFNILEVKYVSNYETSMIELRKKYPLQEIPVNEISLIQKDSRNQIIENNRIINSNYFAELPSHFIIDSISISISDQLVNTLYNKMVSFINNYKAKRKFHSSDDDLISSNKDTIAKVVRFTFGGETVIFRTVVEDEVWSLRIHLPQGDTKKMAEFCKQIIMDARANHLDDSKYISILDTLIYLK